MKNTSQRKEVQLNLSAIPGPAMSRRITRQGRTYLTTVERVLLSERQGISVFALLGRTAQGWVPGWMIVEGSRTHREPPAIRRNRRPQAVRKRAIDLAWQGAQQYLVKRAQRPASFGRPLATSPSHQSDILLDTL